MKTFKGKAIYNPTGKAGEYSLWACNFYTGCSNDCNYCYCKRGVLSSVWSKEAKLKKCFRDEEHALEVFKKELLKNGEDIKATGLFFTFTSDPMLENTIDLTVKAINICLAYEIPVITLTKRADWLEGSKFPFLLKDYLRKDIAFGFTLTGCDEEEAGASMNIERVFAMKKLHDAGFKVWASIEPVIDIPKSMAMINLTSGFCDLYKVGLLSEKRFNATDLSVFIEMVTEMYPNNLFYFKETLINQAKIDRNSLPKNCVTSDYNLFTNN